MSASGRMRASVPVFADVVDELGRALAKFPPFNSPHEGYAVILEELDELWDEVKANRGRTPAARAEAIQVAAMAVRYVVDLAADQDEPPMP